MDRRTYVASLGATTSLLSGCLNAVTNRPPATACTMPEPRRVTISETSGLPARAGLEIDTTLERADITPDAPARLSVTVTNTGEPRYAQLADAEYCHLFHRGRGQSTPAGVWLHRQQNAPDHAGTCWQQPRRPEETRTFISIGCNLAQFGAGESISTTYEVWDDFGTEGYLSPTTYRFDPAIPLRTTKTDDSPTRVDWWTKLTVTNPDA